MKFIEIIIHALIFENNIIIAIGNNNAISTSKINKITGIKKNRMYTYIPTK